MYLHPAKLIADRWPNRSDKDRLEDLLAIRQEIKKIKGRDQVSIVFRHDELDGSEVYSVKRWVKVTEEGSSEHFFDNVSMTATGGTLEATQEQADGEETQELEQVILEDLRNATGAVEDMTRV